MIAKAPRTVQSAALYRLMRFDRPIGIGLLLWPTLWALWLLGRGAPPLFLVFIFLMGVVLTRSLGCVINDWADRRIDVHVERTRFRPLANGEVSSRAALGLAVFLGAASLGCLSVLPVRTWPYAALAAFLMVVYPFTKRWVPFPQAFLGLAFASSIFMIAAVFQRPIPWDLYAAAALWPLAYDTQYALMDREDDLRIGVRSTAVALGAWAPWFIVAVQSIFLLLLLHVAWFFQLSSLFYPFWACAAMFFAFQYFWVEHRLFQQAFSNNDTVGWVIFAGFFFGTF